MNTEQNSFTSILEAIAAQLDEVSDLGVRSKEDELPLVDAAENIVQFRQLAKRYKESAEWTRAKLRSLVTALKNDAIVGTAFAESPIYVRLNRTQSGLTKGIDLCEDVLGRGGRSEEAFENAKETSMKFLKWLVNIGNECRALAADIRAGSFKKSDGSELSPSETISKPSPDNNKSSNDQYTNDACSFYHQLMKVASICQLIRSILNVSGSSDRELRLDRFQIQFLLEQAVSDTERAFSCTDRTHGMFLIRRLRAAVSYWAVLDAELDDSLPDQLDQGCVDSMNRLLARAQNACYSTGNELSEKFNIPYESTSLTGCL